MKVPPTCSVVEPLGAPLKVTVLTDEAPGASVPTDCGSGVPLTPPNLAVVSTTPLAVAVPLLLMVMVATMLLPLHESTVEVPMRGAPAHAVLQTKLVLLTDMVSTRTPAAPVAETLLSVAARNFNWTFCPAAAGGKLAMVVM